MPRFSTRDVLALQFGGLGTALGQSLVLVAAGMVAGTDPWLPLWVEIPPALLLASLASYAVHRAGHTYAWPWRRSDG